MAGSRRKPRAMAYFAFFSDGAKPNESDREGWSPLTQETCYVHAMLHSRCRFVKPLT